MKTGYIAVNNYNRKGDIGISRECIKEIATRAVESVPGAKITKAKKSLAQWIFAWDEKVNVIIHTNDSVEVALNVCVKADTDVQAVCLKIQQEVTSAISLMCETVPLKVSIRVVDVQ